MEQTSALPPDHKGEFAHGWPILLGGILGIAIGIAAIPGPAIGIFMRDMQADLGWSRAEIALGPTLLIMITGLGSPLLGWLTDRIRTAWICGTGLAFLVISLFLLSKLGPDVRIYHLTCVAMAIAAAGAGTLPYAQAISAAFVANRGLALGLATVGTGLTTMLLPAFMTPYAAHAGWRMGFVVLAAIVAIVAPLVVLLMRKAPQRPKGNLRASGTANNIGLASVLSGRLFWILASCFGLVMTGIGGIQLHLVSYLSDAGIDPVSAGRTAALAGVFLLVGRIGTGWLVDRFFAPWVAAMAMSLSAASIVGLSLLGAEAGILGAAAIGLASGAEIDLIGYFTARCFGLEAYGRIYGIFYAISVGGAGLSVVIYGRIFDQLGSYAVALHMSAALLAGSTLLFLMLGWFERSSVRARPVER